MPTKPIDEKEPFCPECGSVLERDGVSGVYTFDGKDVYGPWYCIDCGWAETFEDNPPNDPDEF